MKIPTIINYTIKKIAANKQFLIEYFLKSLLDNDGHYLACLSLEVVIDEFKILIFLNCHNFISGSKHLNHMNGYGMDTMGNIMALKDHLSFKCIYDNKFPKQFKDKIFVFKMLVDLLGVTWILLSMCSWEEIWRIHGQYLTMSNV